MIDPRDNAQQRNHAIFNNDIQFGCGVRLAQHPYRREKMDRVAKKAKIQPDFPTNSY